MQYIGHRITTLAQLYELPTVYGAELDLRDDLNGRIYIQHHPFEQGEDFEAYLKEYHHGTMICNVKSERIELKVLELLDQYGIFDFFFLDSSFPMIHLLAQAREHRMALRFSEYEGMDTVQAMAGKADWVWVDCFSRLPVSKDQFDCIKKMGYHTCLVSPELQGQEEKIEVYARQMKEEGIVFDAICTKVHQIDRWEKLLH